MSHLYRLRAYCPCGNIATSGTTFCGKCGARMETRTHDGHIIAQFNGGNWSGCVQAARWRQPWWHPWRRQLVWRWQQVAAAATGSVATVVAAAPLAVATARAATGLAVATVVAAVATVVATVAANGVVATHVGTALFRC